MHKSKLRKLTMLTIYPTGASHCNDLAPINMQNDSKDMLYAKVAVRNAIKSWVDESSTYL